MICEQCTEDVWSTNYIEGWIIMTCQLCGHVVEFESRNKPKQTIDKPCRRCDKQEYDSYHKTEAELKKKLERRQKQNYGYLEYFKCRGCKTMYMIDASKRTRLDLGL